LLSSMNQLFCHSVHVNNSCHIERTFFNFSFLYLHLWIFSSEHYFLVLHSCLFCIFNHHNLKVCVITVSDNILAYYSSSGVPLFWTWICHFIFMAKDTFHDILYHLYLSIYTVLWPHPWLLTSLHIYLAVYKETSISGTGAAIWSKTNFGHTGYHHLRNSPLLLVCTIPSASATF
jgi:hypothetical protein